MSKQDIRSFFSIKPKSGSNEAPKKRVISDSDDDSENKRQNGSKQKANGPTKKDSKKRRIVDSDEEEDKPKGKSPGNDRKKPNLGKLKEKPKGKEVDISNAFGKSPVKRVDNKKPTVTVDIPSDDEFEKSIAHMETEETVATPRKSPRKRESPPDKKTPAKSSKRDKSPKSKDKPSSSPSKSTKGPSKSPAKVSPVKTPVAKKTAASSTKKASVKKEKSLDLESSVQMDEDRHERKQMASALYQKYKNRANALNHGCKEIPKGRPNCLAGKVFLVTGVLESMERPEAEELIKEYGGKISSGVTKKLNIMVVGEEAGPSKLVKAEEYGVKIITEDDLLDMIRGGPAAPPKMEVKKEKSASPEKKKRIKAEPDAEPEFQTFTVKKKVKVDVVAEEPQPGPSSTTTSTPPADRKPTCDEKNVAWVDKYKPTSIKQIIGQQGPSSNTHKLLQWLKNWHSNHDGKKKVAKPSPWAKNDDGAYFKAALLSGPPGIGKTTTATLVCKELGYDTVEFNASDTRSKRLLKEQVSEILKNKSLFGYVTGHEKRASAKHVLLMDEVDGMAGNEDRGGMAELIALIKDSSVPIICMCNDRQHQKMRSLVNHCFDLRFQRPRLEQIKGAMMSVCFKEQLKVDPKSVEEIITASNNDIRQTINYLAMLSAGTDVEQKTEGGGGQTNVMKKDLKVGPWEVVRKVFSAEEHKKMSIHDKADLFFQDYSMGPLFVQENYLQVMPAGPKEDTMFKVAKAASSLSRGDLIERRIRSQNNWSVLPVQAMFSSVIPGEFMSGHITGQINFPGWLGKNSKRTKRGRMAQEIHDHTRVATSGSRTSVRMDYAPFILAAIVRPLKEEGVEGVAKALEVMREYRISREDIDSLVELTSWPGLKSPLDAVESKVKAALTRAYNKEALAFVPTAKKKAKGDDDEEFLDEGEAAAGDSEEEEETMDNDAMIKQKKKPTTVAAGSADAKGKEKKKPAKKEAVKKAKK